MRILLAAIGAVLFLAAGNAARAEVVDAQPYGFEIRQSVTIKAPAAKVWAAMIKVGDWWNPAHSWSGDSRNITLEARAGGCWCETMPNGGGAQHMRVIYVAPGKEIRFEGALGPFQMSGAMGHMVWTLSEKDGVTTVTQTYDLGGYFRPGLDKVAPGMDGVLAEQAGRLKALVETGKPS